MNIAKLVISNITRNKARFIFTLFGITIGIASFVALQTLSGSLNKEVNKKVNALGASLVVTNKGACIYDQISVITGDQLPQTLPMETYYEISEIEGLTAVPYLTEKTAIQNNPVTVMGILPKEMQVFNGWEVKEGSYFIEEESVIVGSAIAEQFELKPSDEIIIRGNNFHIIGILEEVGNKDDITVFMNLAVAQRIYDEGNNISVIAVNVDDVTKTDEYITAITDRVNVSVYSDRQLLNSAMSLISTVDITLKLISAIALIAATFGIVNTMMSVISERKREIGILQAIGCNSRKIFTITILESGLYGLLGGIAGIFIGLLASMMVAPYFSQTQFASLMKGIDMAANFDIKIAILSILFSVVLSVLSGLYPAYRASKLTPVEAITYE